MKSNLIKNTAVLIFTVLFAFASSGEAQGIFNKIKDKAKEQVGKAQDQAQSEANKAKDHVKNQTNTDTGNISSNVSPGGDATHLNWARLDVQATWTEKGQSKFERRTYYSDIITINQTGVKEKENVSAYFDEGIVEQLKARGIEIKYYSETVDVYPLSNPYDSRASAEEQRNKMIENDKEGGRAVYTFTWKFNAKNVSEEITQPKRIFAPKPAPSIEAATAPVNTAEREAKTQTAQNSQAEAEAAQREKQIWGFVYLNVAVKNKFGQTSYRTYVSEVSAIDRGDFKRFYDDSSLEITKVKDRIWDYFAATVVAGAKARGEEIEQPYDGSINYKLNLGTYAKGNDIIYLYHPKSSLAEPRQNEIDHAKQTGHPIFLFRWDPTGGNKQADLEKEKNRGASKDLPN